ncbi:MAG TPA: L-threonylcarbamoyladenylate synthase [candidate division Zixibacteria bacterium]|nr:threonylcarbamoyl-AMP synthase [candidate division Zixibacteria bacterium]MDD4917842.1 L-threonylcarbamoyladenylate synthase [candidate division Zixibacteria bacterium]MDM7974182.1 L-threonylcarbamoyladenylate synthase [candidate division Zixibacteria bacterium]HOD67653.1 L-threonylcarbamoyladenylate synthase [candidate division Zixibacteria bacterium]HOZ08392.1 L-threonylcarbamoyladenylate synthase [candidate division Zixibacteria bacterium]
MATRPRVEEIDPQAPARELINEAVTVLDGGGLVVAPTETRYGLLARADRKIPADRLARAKRRASEKPISIFVGTIEMITHYAELRPTALRLARIFLPGPLTLVLPAVGSWHPVIAPVGKIGVRVSASPVIQAIMERVEYPVTATSANISGDEENETVEQIVEIFGDEVDLYLDGGPLTGMPSTVIDCTIVPPAVLREGAIDPAEIDRVVRG